MAPDTVVTISYRLSADGELVDDISDAPISFVFGYGQVLPGLEEGLAGLRRGTHRRLELAPALAFGERDEEAMLEIDRHDFPGGEAAEVGSWIEVTGPDGLEVSLPVVEVSEDALLVDRNHPLAGKTVVFEVQVRKVRPARDEEIQAAQQELDEQLVGESAIVYGSQPGTEGSPDLVQLRRPERATAHRDGEETTS